MKRIAFSWGRGLAGGVGRPGAGGRDFPFNEPDDAHIKARRAGSGVAGHARLLGQCSRRPTCGCTSNRRPTTRPKLAVRRKAEKKTAQREARIAAMKWYGLSNSVQWLTHAVVRRVFAGLAREQLQLVPLDGGCLRSCSYDRHGFQFPPRTDSGSSPRRHSLTAML